MPKNLPWTDEETRDLKRLNAAGMSARQAADALHAMGYPARTRNAVIGRLQRLNVASVSNNRRRDSSKGALQSATGTVRRCQWPMWEDKVDHQFCGKPTAQGRPYCGDHAARAYVESKEDHRKSWEVAAE